MGTAHLRLTNKQATNEPVNYTRRSIHFAQLPLSATYSLAPNDWFGITLRLCLALLVGAIIGLERQLRHKPAGLRTHMLVSFGAALFVLVPIQIATAQEIPNLLSRVIQGITAGVGFLGAGEILRESRQEASQVEIRGLTSAAAIWVSAALGVAAGCGLWQIGLIGALLCLVVLRVVKKLEKLVQRDIKEPPL